MLPQNRSGTGTAKCQNAMPIIVQTATLIRQGDWPFGSSISSLRGTGRSGSRATPHIMHSTAPSGTGSRQCGQRSGSSSFVGLRRKNRIVRLSFGVCPGCDGGCGSPARPCIKGPIRRAELGRRGGLRASGPAHQCPDHLLPPGPSRVVALAWKPAPGVGLYLAGAATARVGRSRRSGPRWATRAPLLGCGGLRAWRRNVHGPQSPCAGRTIGPMGTKL